MRIAFLINTLWVGGAERMVVSLSRRMAARGHQVLIVVLRDRRADDLEASVPVVHLNMGKSAGSALRGFLHARRVLREFQPGVVHSHNFHGNLMARLLRLAGVRAPIVSTIHNVREGGRLRRMALRLTDWLSAASVAVSRAAMEQAIKVGAVPRQKCRLIENGIDVANLTPDARRRARMRGEMGAGERFIWLTASRIVPAKDIPNLLRAFARIESADTELWIAGSGDEAYCAELRGEAERLGVSVSVRWLGTRRDVAALMDAADGFVLGSAWEGMPMALGEAMAMEKAVAATDVGGVAELVGDCGSLAPAGDAQALAAAMAREMREASVDRGRTARRRIQERFDADAKAGEWEQVYREVAR
jgi:glycosyltransferase involved in cell wall biosynthesis